MGAARQGKTDQVREEEPVIDRILTLPNVISVIRLCLVPLYLALLMGGQDLAAAVTFAVAAGTDFLDGQIARRTHTVSKLGQLLDPTVDRVLMITGVLGVFLVGRLPLWIILVVVLRDALLLGGGSWLLFKRGIRVPVIYPGKFATTFLFVGFAGLVLNAPLVPGLGLTDAAWLPGFTAAPVSWGIWFIYVGLILAIGTPAAQAVAGSTTEIPVVGTAVTDFAAAGLVEANDAPGGNVTGTSDLNPVSDQIALLQKLVPEAKKVGILYCSAEDNSGIQADLAEKACKDAGLSTERFTVSSSNEIQQVVESMAGKVDAVYAPTDNVIAAGIATVSMVANENNLPVICGEENMVNGGGLATYSLNYRDLGYRAGEMAVKILKGEAKPADMPIEYLSGDDLKLVVNEETAKTLGIDVSGLES